MQRGEENVGSRTSGRLHTERRGGVCHSGGLESDGVGCKSVG